MKKKILFVGAVLASTFSFSQTPVSQTTTKKNVLLEEFTGIHCTWCPDGHKLANELAAANPNRVVLVNVHAGGYASPYTGELDLRTSNGNSITSWMKVTGFPAGAVQRKGYDAGSGLELGMSRFDWETVATPVFNENAPVNIAMDAQIDATTRKLTIKVEMFYTAPFASGTKNYLNVGIIQDNIEEYQIGSSKNTAQILPNGKYNHMHVFRKYINSSGVYGDVIDADQTTVITKTFEYVLPESITSVPLKIFDLKIFAFVHQGTNDVSNSLVYNAIDVNPQITNVTGISEIANSTYLNVFPNPATDKLNVAFKAENTDYTINIMDLSGRVISSNSYSNLSDNQSIELPLTGISSGNYIVSVSSVNGTVNQHVAIK